MAWLPGKLSLKFILMKILALLPLFAILLLSCNSEASPAQDTALKTEAPKDLSGLQKAYFASGCFWCVEAIFESVNGVEEAISGYAGGNTDDPTYESIGTGRTGHAESVELYYDPAIVSFSMLVDVFYGSQNPTTTGQAPDFGSQYRSIIFYQNEEEQAIAEQKKAEVNASGEYEEDVITEILPLKKFYNAEDYHQDYERNNPNNPYVRNVSVPRLNSFKASFPQLLKEGH